MNFCIRVDDYGWIPEDSDTPPLKLPDDGMKLAQRFHAALQGYPYLAGVIPTCVDHDGLEWIQSTPVGMTVALHGFNHHKSDDDVASEFRNLTRDECLTRIAAGKGKLGMFGIRHMILPFNHFEPELIDACYVGGITHIWGGAAHDEIGPSEWPTPPQPYSIGPIRFVPSWYPTYGATRWHMGNAPALTDTIPVWKELPGRAIVTLHITWEAAHGDKFDGVRWLVNELADRIISPEEYLS